MSGEGQGMGAGRGSSRSSGRRLRPLESLNVDAYFKEGLERVCFGHIRVRWVGEGVSEEDRGRFNIVIVML